MKTSPDLVLLTCHDARGDGGDQRRLGAIVYPGQDVEEQFVLGHGVDDSRHGEHGAQEAEINNS